MSVNFFMSPLNINKIYIFIYNEYEYIFSVFFFKSKLSVYIPTLRESNEIKPQII